MKNLITFIFFVWLTNGFSQVWIGSDAKWTFDYTNVGESGTWRWVYTHDTIIQGHPSQVIKAIKYRYGGPGNAVINYGNVYTYASNDSVFYFRDNRFFLLYDFGAHIGDTWMVAIDTLPYECQDTAFVQVIDTGNIVINGLELRTITLQTISESFHALNGLCVEKFGIFPTTAENNNFGFLPGYQNCQGGPIVDYDILTFRCYEDTGFPAFNPNNTDCDTLTSANEHLFRNFRIYPNPSHTDLYIDSPDKRIKYIVILDLKYRIIDVQEFRGNIDISHLKNGIYFIRIVDEDKKETMGKFIKQ